MRVIAVANQKGGCGKTTTSINFAACLANLQKKVLLVDMDPQGHSTCGYGIRAEKLPYTLYDLLNEHPVVKPEFSQVLVQLRPNLFLLPTYVVLAALEEELANTPQKDRRLKKILDAEYEQGRSFDYVIIDCPPNLGVLTYNAFEAADELIIPIEPSFFSLHGLAKVSETIRGLNQRRPIPLEVHALLTLFNSGVRFAEDVFQEVREHFGEKMFKSVIHEDVALKEAAGAGVSIDQHDRSSQGYRDYAALAVEFLEREWQRRLPEDKLGWHQVLRQHFGPRRVMGGVLFQAAAENAQTVEIVGDFNQWIPEPMIRRDGKLWQLVVPITRGQYRYKFIVDGEWQLDAGHDKQKANDFGRYDSFLELSDAG